MKPEKTRQNRDSGGDILQGKGGPYRFSDHLVPYPEALADMEAQVAALATGSGREQLWFLEHPPLYTSGTSARAGRPSASSASASRASSVRTSRISLAEVTSGSITRRLSWAAAARSRPRTEEQGRAARPGAADRCLRGDLGDI